MCAAHRINYSAFGTPLEVPSNVAGEDFGTEEHHQRGKYRPAPDLTKVSRDKPLGLCGGAVEHQERPRASILTRNLCADWKVTYRFANMESLLLLGAYPSGVEMRNTG